MYTNISHTEGLSAIKKCLNHNPDHTQTRPPTNLLLHPFRITLTKNDLLFDEEFYLQICGTAMGKTYAPSYANIFMAERERHIFRKLHLKPLLYVVHQQDRLLLSQLHLTSLQSGWNKEPKGSNWSHLSELIK